MHSVTPTVRGCLVIKQNVFLLVIFAKRVVLLVLIGNVVLSSDIGLVRAITL